MWPGAKGIGMVVGLWLLAAAPLSAQQELQNIQYFSADVTRDSLVRVMREFSFALGVRCQYCHVGGDGVSFEGVRFESDDDPDKRKARHMLRLVDTINEGLLPMMADRDTPVSEVSCKTCHRGQPKPLLLKDALRAALDDGGAGAARERYADLRENAALSGSFDFGEWEVNTLAESLQRAGRLEDAVSIYQLNLEQYPRSISILLSLGGLHEQLGASERALARYRDVLEIAPENRTALARVAALGGAPR